MTAPILMMVLLTLPYGVARLVHAMTGRNLDVRTAAALGLALLFTFTGIGHFTETSTMAQMLPPWMPARVQLVYLTGILELAMAVGFIFRGSRRAAGWTAAALLVLFFPVNVYAAMQHIPQGGHLWGPAYLLIRGPVQLLILLWDYWFILRKRPHRLRW